MRSVLLATAALIVPVTADAQSSIRVPLPENRAIQRQSIVGPELEITRGAFEQLSRGDPSGVSTALDGRVQWRAIGRREFSNGVTFDRTGAELYLRRMARAVSAGTHRLEIQSIVQEVDAVRVDSVWIGAGGVREQCRNMIFFANGRVIKVIEGST
jgi:hypothetical protein